MCADVPDTQSVGGVIDMTVSSPISTLQIPIGAPDPDIMMAYFESMTAGISLVHPATCFSDVHGNHPVST